MRILLCNWRDITHPAHGGAEVYTHEVLRRWAADGHEVTWFSAASLGRPAREVIDGVEMVRAGSRLGVYREARRWYRTEGRTRGFDVVIDEVNTRPFACHRWVDDAPVVALAHQVAKEVWFAELPLPLAAAGRFVLEPHWLRELRHVPTMTISASSRRSLLDAGLQRVVEVPVGVEVAPRPIVAKEQRPTALFVGRLAANKRPDHAAAAVSLARRHLPDLQLWVVGDGPLRDRLEGIDGVHVVGRVDQDRKAELMARAHCLLVTSIREGWGMVVDEAAHMGTPAIGYDVAGLRDSIDAAHGRLVEPCPEAMAQAIVDELPALAAGTATPRAPRAGGAVSWDTVAEVVLERVRTLSAMGRAAAPPVPGSVAA